ncbi:MAG: sugar ABC transporter permease [Bifidobacteriaceae bacterium]|nr:sugar ABC transporter permease [Bifidobacteriaceae bacterium]MCI1914829.1 sugar ABC transporter permease [Bifidobacteriaceae bacterium]
MISKHKRTGAMLSKYTPVLPAVILMLVFLLGPIIWSVYASFTNVSLVGATAIHPQFVGLDNYVAMFKDPDFFKSIWLTVLLILFSAIIGQNVLGMFLAVLSSKAAVPVRKVSEVIIVLAWIIPDVVGCYCAYAFFAGEGTVDTFGSFFGLDLSSLLYDHPMTVIVLANIWRGTAFSMMIYQAALNDVPEEVVEAGLIDGAKPMRIFFSIKMPIIKRSILTNLMLTTLQTLSVFSLIIILTGGGPGTNSSTLPVLAYDQAFKFSKLGYGVAISAVTILIGGIFSIVYMRMLKTEKED